MRIFFPSDTNQELFTQEALDLGVLPEDLIEEAYSVSIHPEVLETVDDLLELIHAYDGQIED